MKRSLSCELNIRSCVLEEQEGSGKEGRKWKWISHKYKQCNKRAPLNAFIAQYCSKFIL